MAAGVHNSYDPLLSATDSALLGMDNSRSYLDPTAVVGTAGGHAGQLRDTAIDSEDAARNRFLASRRFVGVIFHENRRSPPQPASLNQYTQKYHIQLAIGEKAAAQTSVGVTWRGAGVARRTPV